MLSKLQNYKNYTRYEDIKILSRNECKKGDEHENGVFQLNQALKGKLYGKYIIEVFK
ncbi:hypothetical protein [Bacillus cereus group sp. BfR-BA-01380]|uniref:hypothetical protein n=1 Tax=Bacillus cereus group sp. BfR-BA-01380 TaxID=2920324 RepID=UPI001F574D7C|nr:hypothetical protein [Bacillus cereus group sp. BfR-BA-01380]